MAIGALARDPKRKPDAFIPEKSLRKPAGGALAKDPTTKPAPNADRINTRIKYLQKYRPHDPEIKQLQKRLAGLKPAEQTAPAPDPTNPMAPTPGDPSLGDINHDANQGMDNVFNQIQQEGAFNPGTFEQQQQEAYQHVMDQFNRTMQPQFDKQLSDLNERFAQTGVDPNSEGAQLQMKQLMDNQNTARQNMMDQAYGQGLQAQQQGYGQAAQTYQMPYQNLGAFSPFYQGQVQGQLQSGAEGFTAGQNQLDRDQAIRLQQMQNQQQMRQLQFAASRRGGGGGGGGGGGMSLADQMALQNNQFYNNLVLYGLQGGQQQGPQQGYGSGFGSGLAGGIQNTLGSLIKG